MDFSELFEYAPWQIVLIVFLLILSRRKGGRGHIYAAVPKMKSIWIPLEKLWNEICEILSIKLNCYEKKEIIKCDYQLKKCEEKYEEKYKKQSKKLGKKTRSKKKKEK